MNVADRMSRGLLTTEPETSLREAAQRMVERRVGSIVIVERDRLVGILTERDVLGVFARGEFEARVSDVMTRHPETVSPDETLAQARLVMLHGGFRHLPVVEGAKLVGMLSMRDLFTAGEDEAPRGV
ncbi:MAG TPA: CBS domain-containing protein [Gaiellaceae bacterium]|nr:CBS domain-containing protein [Gaiellaceae bacterium]